MTILSRIIYPATFYEQTFQGWISRCNLLKYMPGSLLGRSRLTPGALLVSLQSRNRSAIPGAWKVMQKITSESLTMAARVCITDGCVFRTCLLQLVVFLLHTMRYGASGVCSTHKSKEKQKTELVAN